MTDAATVESPQIVHARTARPQELRGSPYAFHSFSEARALLDRFGFGPYPTPVWKQSDDDLISRDKSELSARLKRIAGQVGGIQRMLDDDRSLLEVVTQLSAVRAALGGVANIVLGLHVEERANELLASGDVRERRELVSELMQLFEKRHRDT